MPWEKMLTNFSAQKNEVWSSFVKMLYNFDLDNSSVSF